MKLLLDENLPHELRHRLPGHDVFTVSYMGWSGTKNGALLRLAADAGFEAFLTMDDGVTYQQNVATLPATTSTIWRRWCPRFSQALVGCSHVQS